MVAGGITPGAFPALVARRPVNIFAENCSVAKIRCNWFLKDLLILDSKIWILEFRESNDVMGNLAELKQP